MNVMLNHVLPKTVIMRVNKSSSCEIPAAVRLLFSSFLYCFSFAAIAQVNAYITIRTGLLRMITLYSIAVNSMIRLSLLERLSQVYFNKVAILCGLSIVKIWLLRRSLIDKLNDLDNELTQLNQLMTDVISKYSQYAESAWKRGLLDLVTTVKGLFIFFIEIWLGTYACLVGHLIEGTVDFSLDISESVVSKVNSTVFTVADALDAGVSGLSSFIDSLVSLFTGRDKSAAYLSSISEGANSLRLLATNISEEALNGIESIKSKVPDFTNLHNTTESLLGVPFDKLTSRLNGTNSTLSKAPSSLMTSSTNKST